MRLATTSRYQISPVANAHSRIRTDKPSYEVQQGSNLPSDQTAYYGHMVPLANRYLSIHSSRWVDTVQLTRRHINWFILLGQWDWRDLNSRSTWISVKRSPRLSYSPKVTYYVRKFPILTICVIIDQYTNRSVNGISRNCTHISWSGAKYAAVTP